MALLCGSGAVVKTAAPAALAAVVLLCLAMTLAVGMVTPHLEAALDAVAAAGNAAGRLEPQVAATLASVQAIETNTTRTEAELAGLLNETRHIAIDERAAQQAQLAQVADIGRRTRILLDDADNAVKAVGTMAPAVRDSVSGISVDAHATAIASQSLLTAATADLSDPAIRQSEADAAVAARNLAIASQQTAMAMTDLHAALDHEIAVIERPVSKVKAAALFTASIFQHLLGL
jgi:hypothetical protein